MGGLRYCSCSAYMSLCLHGNVSGRVVLVFYLWRSGVQFYHGDIVMTHTSSLSCCAG